MCTVWMSHSKWQRVEQWICIKSCIKLEHSLAEIICVIQMGNWWLAASSQQHAHSCITSHAEFFGKTSNHPDESAPLQPRFGILWLLAFPKTEITFEREEISGLWWDLRKYVGAADSDLTKDFAECFDAGRTVWGPKMPPLKGTEASLFCVQCFLCLVSSSINVAIFHGIWLDTFWTDLVY